MRSAIGPILAILGVAVTVVMVLVLLQVVGLRGDVARAEGRMATLEASVAAQEPAVTLDEVQRELDELRTWTRDWLIATGADGGGDGDTGTPAGEAPGDADLDGVMARLDLVLERITALDERVDEICGGVPVC